MNSRFPPPPLPGGSFEILNNFPLNFSSFFSFLFFLSSPPLLNFWPISANRVRSPDDHFRSNLWNSSTCLRPYTTALRCGLSFSSMSFGLSKGLEKRLTLDVRFCCNIPDRPTCYDPHDHSTSFPKPSSTPGQYNRLA